MFCVSSYWTILFTNTYGLPRTYTKRIASILHQRCVGCHRAGEVAPFPLVAYDEVVGWAETISEVIADGRMPPWHANPEHGKFYNDIRLSEREKELINAWIKNACPQGDAADLPPLSPFVEGWRIPKPDMVYRMPQPFNVPAKGGRCEENRARGSRLTLRNFKPCLRRRGNGLVRVETSQDATSLVIRPTLLPFLYSILGRLLLRRR